MFREQGITIFSVLTVFSMTIPTVVLATTGVFGGGGRGTGGSPEKDERALKKWTHKTCKKCHWSIACYCRKCCWCNLSFLWKAVGFVAKHTWALIAFVAGLVGVWLMQKVKKILGPCQWLSHQWSGHKPFYDLIKVIKILFFLVIKDGRYSHGIKIFSFQIY